MTVTIDNTATVERIDLHRQLLAADKGVREMVRAAVEQDESEGVGHGFLAELFRGIGRNRHHNANGIRRQLGQRRKPVPEELAPTNRPDDVKKGMTWVVCGVGQMMLTFDHNDILIKVEGVPGIEIG